VLQHLSDMFEGPGQLDARILLHLRMRGDRAQSSAGELALLGDAEGSPTDLIRERERSPCASKSRTILYSCEEAGIAPGPVCDLDRLSSLDDKRAQHANRDDGEHANQCDRRFDGHASAPRCRARHVPLRLWS
jgi:hypothetical protein